MSNFITKIFSVKFLSNFKVVEFELKGCLCRMENWVEMHCHICLWKYLKWTISYGLDIFPSSCIISLVKCNQIVSNMELMHFHIFSMPLFVFCVSLLQLCLDLFMHLSFTFFCELFNLLFLLVGFYSLFFLLVIYRVKWWLWKELITNFKWYHVSRWVNCPIACMLNVGFHPISCGIVIIPSQWMNTCGIDG